MCWVRWSNEAASTHADIWPDQPDVPAVFPLLWQGAKPSTPTTTNFNLLHCCRNLISLLIIYSGLSKDVENLLFILVCMIADPIVADKSSLFISGSSPTLRRWYSSGSIYTWWCLFWSWRTFGNASLIHNRQRLFWFFVTNLHVSGFSSCRII